LIVPDASTLTTALVIADERGRRARNRLSADDDQHAPGLLDLEVASALRRLLRVGIISEDQANQALGDLVVHPVERYTHAALLPRIWDLRHNVTPYDAAYVALAEALGAVLVTADARLANAPGLRCAVEVLR
jgi:predicted nucleic acid-binding protein